MVFAVAINDYAPNFHARPIRPLITNMLAAVGAVRVRRRIRLGVFADRGRCVP